MAAVLNPLYRAGGRLLEAATGAGTACMLLVKVGKFLPDTWKRRKTLLDRMVFCSYGSVGVTALVGLFTGMVMSLQAGLQLADFNQEHQVGLLVVKTMFMEMGPVMTGIILAALVGSAYAAEIGTMQVSEEVDALRVMSIEPVSYLVLPRVLALTVVAPVMSLFSCIVGIAGGALVATGLLRVDLSRYLERAEFGLEELDMWVGLLKATCFGLTIAIVACSQGLSAKRGAAGVGAATMNSVVISFVLILIFDYIISWFFF
jgi:phospholipid/cholesterol/gamma-HCH transport system permease protein